ncbi:pseudouridine-5'-phosphate glycosidase [Fodinicola feengrottensis]|uniref:pseudouridine-5'-phosphate glycosidase n=1 Tax=Fodinicola feengrottensis TaxID=435914 RepID=UPI002442EF23|nr:pseudouridine-5'-phosphate glycosidase [Fodinicola feengrottensis]
MTGTARCLPFPPEIVVGDEVALALAHGRPLVALESTLIAHGLPRPRNLAVARELGAAVRAAGATPATIGVLDGKVVVGLDDDQLTRIALGEDVPKLSVRDIPFAVSTKSDGATTVASTAAIAHRVGIGVFATGGLGGVHRDAAYDESADLQLLGRTPITIVCAGVKSILDVPATLERLESLSVLVAGYRTDRFPGFYLADSGHQVPWTLDNPAQVAAAAAARDALGFGLGAIVLANPIPVDRQLDPVLHDRVLAEALAGAAAQGVTGKDITPYLLAYFHEATGGGSLEVNIDLVSRNATLAAQIAVAAAGTPGRPGRTDRAAPLPG